MKKKEIKKTKFLSKDVYYCSKCFEILKHQTDWINAFYCQNGRCGQAYVLTIGGVKGEGKEVFV